MVSLFNPHTTQNTLTALFKPEGAPEWWLTCVYAPQLDHEKVEFLEELVEIRDLHVGPWAVVGDFNLLAAASEKSNDAVNRRMIARFRSSLNRLELKELYLSGRRFTWSNERENATKEKIDHVFNTNAWEDLHPFRFEAFWPRAEGFMDTVSMAWNSVPSVGNPFVVLDNKLRATAKKLQGWSDRWIGNVKLQIAMAMELIYRLDSASDHRLLTVAAFLLRKTLKRKLLGLCSLERGIARQRSRILHLREGDASTEFFYRHVRQRQRKNMITSLKKDEQLITGHDQIAEEVDDYYGQLLGTTKERGAALRLEDLGLPRHDLSHLELPFTEEELEKVVKLLPPDKAPGPDGFTNRLYACCWSIIKLDLLRALDAFYRGDTRGACRQ
ncbi:uncharacterized protein [Aegilops tauschii subsp. strangulata]|uniref:uncharacterized protein n=1 Tax=Aegilops tauschii subsp. strangulata TaxID=200361 RepID=UPI003CC852E0